MLNEFYNLVMASSLIEQGGLSYAQSLLEKSLSSDMAFDIIRQVSQTIQKAIQITEFVYHYSIYL